jgi:hypothetical protein
MVNFVHVTTFRLDSFRWSLLTWSGSPACSSWPAHRTQQVNFQVVIVPLFLQSRPPRQRTSSPVQPNPYMPLAQTPSMPKMPFQNVQSISIPSWGYSQMNKQQCTPCNRSKVVGTLMPDRTKGESQQRVHICYSNNAYIHA